MRLPVLFSFSVAIMVWIWPLQDHAYLSAEMFRTLDTADATAFLHDVARSHGSQAAWHYLKVAYQSPDGILVGAASVHMLAHAAGRDFYREFQMQGLSECEDIFTRGCHHGVIEQMVMDRGPEAYDELVAICMGTPDAHVCAHGVGHAFHEAGRGDVSSASGSCERAFDAGDARQACLEGVFMAHTRRIGPERFTADAWAFCTGFREEYRSPCAAAMPIRAIEIAREPFAVVAEFCSRAPGDVMRERCVTEYAYAIVRESRNDAMGIIGACDYFGSHDRSACLSAAKRLVEAGSFAQWESVSRSLATELSECMEASCGPR